MQIIYALPFILLSTVCFVVCLAIPRLRRYVLTASIVPVAFGFCSIVTTAAVLITADKFGLFQESQTMDVKNVVIVLLIYFVPGVLGAWLAVSCMQRVQRFFQTSPLPIQKAPVDVLVIDHVERPTED
jgi:hypothetical protein